MIARRKAGKVTTTHPPVQATDRRAAQRVPVQILVRFSAADSFQHVGHGMALDLSESGCKLYSALMLPVGSFWDLYLTISGTTNPVLISKVRVVWVVGNEYGIEFLLVTAKERTRLRHFIWKHMNHSTLKGGPPLFTLIDHSGLRRRHLKSLP